MFATKRRKNWGDKKPCIWDGSRKIKYSREGGSQNKE